VHIFSFFVFKYYICPICCNFCVWCTAGIHNTVTSPSSYTGLGMCVLLLLLLLLYTAIMSLPEWKIKTYLVSSTTIYC
jgi:hypothetical protein